jgi:hypothetical protein
VIGRARHLHDDRLFECYASARTSEPLDPRLAEHLIDCGSCAARYAELAAFMDELSTEADAETDAVFTLDRLRAQQQQIAQRIEHVGRPARVISFPRPSSGDHIPAMRPPHVRSRWIAAAAAAGLFMGVALGVAFEWERHARPGTDSVAEAQPLAAPGRLGPGIPVATDGTTPSPEIASDDSFLSDLDVALERPRFGGELQTFDALTPHVREIRNVR